MEHAMIRPTFQRLGDGKMPRNIMDSVGARSMAITETLVTRCGEQSFCQTGMRLEVRPVKESDLRAHQRGNRAALIYGDRTIGFFADPVHGNIGLEPATLPKKTRKRLPY